uniref:ST6 N-acetylgalactosaminide alpha-2,6-sialyltransferase 6 n=1 Tax=Sus scrofa TaxID=9823 RepID=F1RS05_PIG
MSEVKTKKITNNEVLQWSSCIHLQGPGAQWRMCEPTSLTPGPPAGRWPLPLSRRRRREMSSNKEQRSAVFVILFALITILILYSSNSANEVFHYGSQLGRTRRPVNLKKWSITDGYVPLLGNKTLPSRCHQCVIVTSSSHLLGTKLGPEIERAECTIRMNDAPTTGYSADVGNKTTFRVVAHSSVFVCCGSPRSLSTGPLKPCSSSGVPRTRCRSRRAAWCASSSGQAWSSPTWRPTPCLSGACASLTTSSGVRQGKVPFVVEHRLVHHGDCGGVV